MTQAQKTVSVDCPVCCSGNHFNLDENNPGFICRDCGFLLADAATLEGLTLGRCVICGNDRFYLELTIELKFLGRVPRCYVCDAEYRGIASLQTDDKYSYETREALLNSVEAQGLKERADLWH
jgi:hypothetical protein